MHFVEGFARPGMSNLMAEHIDEKTVTASSAESSMLHRCRADIEPKRAGFGRRANEEEKESRCQRSMQHVLTSKEASTSSVQQ